MFITLEGIEGSGKTTQAKHMVNFLQNNGHDCVLTREPGGTRIGKKIRAILLDPESKDIDPLTELLLYNADRVQHIKRLIGPSLSAGKTVVCDRYCDATRVYQGFARGLDIGLVNRLHQMVCDGLTPDITFLLDLTPQLGLSRAWKQIENGARTGAETRFEEETLAFHENVRSGYLELARNEPERFKIIDASRDEHDVKAVISNILSTEINPNT
ncbi:MAG: dTMP kinase [Desulfobacterales bacterium]|nr:MAG: dTMP kinase [Desulfobacterales bacterium]